MTKKKEKKEEIKVFTFEGEITGTSNKQSEEFVTDNPRKTAFIKANELNTGILLDQGLTQYTSEDGEEFFIIKLSEKVTIWDINGEDSEFPTDIKSDNFKTGTINMACVKGKKSGNDYVRIYAFGMLEDSTIELIEKENPFL